MARPLESTGSDSHAHENRICRRRRRRRTTSRCFRLFACCNPVVRRPRLGTAQCRSIRCGLVADLQSRVAPDAGTARISAGLALAVRGVWSAFASRELSRRILGDADAFARRHLAPCAIRAPWISHRGLLSLAGD